MHREANLTLSKKVKCQFTTFILAILVDLPSPLTYAKIQPQDIKCQFTTFILAILVDLPSPLTYAKIQPQDILHSGEENF